MTHLENRPFNFLRSIFWPVHRREAKKVLSMVGLLLLLCISYSILRNLKDTIILTAEHSGAEVRPFIKVWGMLPAAFVATWVFTRLRRWFSQHAVFYILVSAFVSYFLLFAFVLYPHSAELHLNRLGDFLSAHLPQGFHGLIALIRNWTFTSFYVISELWSSVILAILYWGFANDVTEVGEAKRTYGLLHFGANIAPIIGGALAIVFSEMIVLPFLKDMTNSWGRSIIQLVLIITVVAVLAMTPYYWINKKIIPRKPADAPVKSMFSEQKEKKISLRESIRYIAHSKYLLSLAMIVLGYNISINLTDVLWKEQLKRFFDNPHAMLEHMNMITMGIGSLATLGGFLFSVMVVRLGWTFTAMITPLIMTVLATGFFGFLFFGNALSAISLGLFGVAPVAMAVYCGSVQNCLSKATKYSIFDASKELAFLPLSPESKLKGKSAIDGLGSSLGKSGSSLIYQAFILFFGAVSAATPYIAVLLFVILSLWIFAVFSLGKRFKKMTVPTEEKGESPISIPSQDPALIQE